MSQPTSEIDRSTFDGDRFGRKLGIWVGISFGFFFSLAIIVYSGSLVMNDYIYKSPLMRFVLGVYGSLGFLFTIPYYIYRHMVIDNEPEYFTLFPLRTTEFENSIAKYLFGKEGWFPIVWQLDKATALRLMPYTSDKPHPKDDYPLPIDPDILNL